MSDPAEPPATSRLAVSRALDEIARLLRLSGGATFRARAFAGGARALEALDQDLDRLVREGRLTEVPGIGPGLARVIEELHRTGRSSLLEELRAGLPPGALALSRLRSLSVSRMRALHEALGITSLAELEAACRAGRVREVRGMGPATEARLLAELEQARERQGRLLLHEALELGDSVLRHLQRSPGIDRASLAGELRRCCETVDRLTLVAAGDHASAAAQALAGHPRVESVREADASGATGVLASGTPVRVEWVPGERYGSELARRTGSESHWRKLGASETPAAEEEQLYERLGLPFVPPELREDDGELEAARAGTLRTDLVVEADVLGMVHCHTDASDGRHTILQMARAAEALGVHYLTITDHSRSASYAGGLSIERLERQWDEIAAAQEETRVRLLRGSECDVLEDGSLDYPDVVLEKLEVVVASVHNRHRLDEQAMTRRVERALRHPVFKIWGHARGRLIGRRPPFACDMERLLDVAAGARTAIEINGDPHRLDMDPWWAKRARARGLRFVLSVDAHATRELANLRYAVCMARRAGLTRDDVLNTRDAAAFAAAVRPA